MTCIQLSTVAVECKRARLQADVRSSLRFCEPLPTAPEFVTPEDILRLRNEENLWIAPAPACRLQVSVQLLGRVAGQTLHPQQLAGWIEGCNIWERLKLRVSYCDRGDDSTLEFSIQHSDLSASMICPPTAVKAELQALRCHIEITAATAAAGRLKRKRQSDTMIMIAEDRQARPWISLPSTDGLHLEDWSSVHDFVAGSVSYPLEFVERLESMHHRQFEQLVSAAITALVTGSTRHFTDVRIKQSNVHTALVKLAPAVFNGSYVESIADRAQYLPVIVDAVASMQQAQSPRLRRKVEALVSRTTGSVVGGIQKRLWDCLISHTRLSAVPGPRMVVAQKEEPASHILQDNTSDSELICLGEDLVSSDLSHATQVSRTANLGKESPIVELDYDAFHNSVPYEGDEFTSAIEDGNLQIFKEDVIEFGSQFFSL